MSARLNNPEYSFKDFIIIEWFAKLHTCHIKVAEIIFVELVGEWLNKSDINSPSQVLVSNPSGQNGYFKSDEKNVAFIENSLRKLESMGDRP